MLILYEVALDLFKHQKASAEELAFADA